MKYFLTLITIFTTLLSFSQNIQVDSQTFTSQELVEDILINSGCINNVVVTNIVGGDFSNTDQSYGYFDASGTTFPLQSGIVLSTGRLQNVEGPNTTLSDDNAPNWTGDSDLENILNESNTINATILEFDFISVASQISFRYLFASEEYQQGNPNTCQYSDLFGFLIRPASSQQYTNIALVPNTQTPVKVTTVHPEIPGGCSAQNEAYFGSWNGSSAPINFNGQTKVLTATANVTPNETYHVKLVIADEQNYRYDSAVFLEAGSFVASIDLGPDRLLATSNPLCEGETLQLNAYQQGGNSYTWFKDNVEILDETNDSFTVSESGIYKVEVDLGSGCISYGEIVVEYSANPIVNNTILVECDNDADGLFFFNLNDAEQDITGNNSSLYVSNYFTQQPNAISDSDPIDSDQITNFQNTSQNQIVYARVENQYGCFSVAQIELQATYNPYNLNPYPICDDIPIDGYTTFDLDELENNLASVFPTGSSITFYENEQDAFDESNPKSGNYSNIDAFSQVIYVKVRQNNQCISLSTVELQVDSIPLLEPDITNDNPVYYCLNSYPETITLQAGIVNDSPSNYTYQWFLDGTDTGVITSSIEINQTGTYQVIATGSNGCPNTISIIVAPSNIATIENIEVTDASDNNTISILVSGEGDYEFALDDENGFYQDSNIFEYVTPGFHTVYVRDKNNCGNVNQPVSIIGFPKFFTPNNDGYNDTWNIMGISNQFQTNTVIHIFDRRGKLLKQLSPIGPGWDGTYLGQPLANDDYWFSVELEDGRTFKDHFTLKR